MASPQPDFLPFDGKTYDPALDSDRLGRQLRAVLKFMRAGKWWTLDEISRKTGEPQASVSARLRDLRKTKFGGWTVERRRRGEPKAGLWEYRVHA